MAHLLRAMALALVVVTVGVCASSAGAERSAPRAGAASANTISGAIYENGIEVSVPGVARLWRWYPSRHTWLNTRFVNTDQFGYYTFSGWSPYHYYKVSAEARTCNGVGSVIDWSGFSRYYRLRPGQWRINVRTIPRTVGTC